MPFSLITEAWLPVIRRQSGACWIRPAQLTDALETDPVMALDWPRADFRLASLEFLIGLVAVACPPGSPRGWARWDESPPPPEMLDTAFAPFTDVFNLDGDGPRFMQDFESLNAEPNDVATLLIESPGEQSIKKNADLLNKRGQVLKLCRAAAAMALYTLQTFAPAGGAGNRTGLRGGGPLTTLAIPPGTPSLWHLLWANTPQGMPAPQKDWPLIFPWLAKTRTSETNVKVEPASGCENLVFWAAPRRIRLVFEPAKLGEICDLTNLGDSLIVTGWRQRPYGANYDSEAFVHPLTPRYKPKPKEQVSLPVHPQPAGIGYKDFLGLLVSSPDGAAVPASCIATYRTHRAPPPDEVWRILAAGFDMDNMKARGFVETELPVFGGADPMLQDETLRRLIAGAEAAASLLRNAVRGALFSEGAKPDLAASLFNTLRARFWQESAADFYAQAQRAAQNADRDDIALSFLRALGGLALKLFDEVAPITDSDHPPRVAKAAKFLGLALNGYGKSGATFFGAFNLPPPVTEKKGKAA